MGSDLYEVRVAARQGATVRLDIRVVHPDAMEIPADKSFALLMLHEATTADSPLAQAVRFDDVLDEAWETKHASAFIEHVKVKDLRHKPPKAAEANPAHPYWKQPREWLKGTLEVTTTDPAWCEHLKRGMRFDSRSFQVARGYAPSAPMAPGGKLGAEAPAAFMWLPKVCFHNWERYHRAPAALQVPAYGERAYEVLDKTTGKKPDLKRLKSWIGQPVAYEWRGEVRDGSLVAISPELGVAHFSGGRHGIGGFALEEVPWVGRLALKPRARPGPRLFYADVIARVPTYVSAARVQGRTLELELRVGPKQGLRALRSETDLLKLLLLPLCPCLDLLDVLRSRAPLARAVRAELKGGDVLPEEALARFAQGYIRRSQLTRPKPVRLPDLDGLPQEQVKAFFESEPWAKATVRIEVTDPNWISHFKSFSPYPVPTKPGRKAAAWKGPPRRWEKG